MGRRSFITATLFILASLIGSVPSASGYEMPDIAVIPSSHDFGVVNDPASSATLKVTILNNGLEDLTVREMSLASGRHYSLDPGRGEGSCGSLAPVLSPGASCTVIITFSPRAEGELTNLLVIRSDDPDTPEFRMPLKGTGYMPRGVESPSLGGEGKDNR